MFMTTKETAAFVGVCNKTLHKWEQEGTFPKRKLALAGRVAWVRAEVEDWVSRCMQAGAGLVEQAVAYAALPVISLLWHKSTDTLDFAYWSDKELTITKRTVPLAL